MRVYTLTTERVLLTRYRYILAALLVSGLYAPANAAEKPGDVATAVTPAEAWPMFRGSAGLTGVSASTVPDDPKLLWRFETDEPIKSSPVIAHGRVYFGSNDRHVYAVTLADGKKAWSFKTEDYVEAPPTVDGDFVYAGLNDGVLYKLNAKTGELIWKYTTEAQISGAANVVRFDDKRRAVLVGSHDNMLHCVDAATGKAIWTYETDNFVNGAATIDNGRVIFGGCDGFIHVVNLADGKSIRKIEIGSYIAGSAALS